MISYISGDDAQGLAKRLAVAMKDGWSYRQPKVGDEKYPTAYIDHTTGLSLYIWLATNGVHNGKARIGGLLPDGQHVGGALKIWCATSRPIHAIATDVRRRLLPLYIEQHAAAAKRVADAEARAKLAELSLKALRIAAGHVGSSTVGPDRFRIWHDPGGDADCVQGDVTVSGSTVALSLHGLPGGIARKILELLASCIWHDPELLAKDT